MVALINPTRSLCLGGFVTLSDKLNADSPFSRVKLLKSSAVVYAAMGFVGFEICWWYHLNLPVLFSIEGVDWFLSLRIAVMATAFLLLGQLCLEEFVPSYRRLKGTFAKIFRNLRSVDVVFLAFVSSVGEELLFRGAIQPFLGVWLTSVIFALLHMDPEGKFSVWTLWAFIAGLVMGYSVEITQHLWAAILIHFCVNLISIFRINRVHAMHRESAQSAATISEPKT